MAGMDQTNYKDSIVRFIRNSPEAENEKIAAFIEGMKAGKQAAGGACPAVAPDTFSSSPLPAEEIRI
jgi:hypothetical protein